MGEVFFIIGLVGGLVCWTLFLSGLARRYWFITMATIGATVGLMEGFTSLKYGATISQLYWHWSVRHVVTSWICMGMLIGGMIFLAVHLQWKVMFKRNYTKKLKGE